MSENIVPPTRKDVLLEGRRAFEDEKLRGSNPYVKRNQEFALIWWNGWDAAQAEKRKKVNSFGEITHEQRERAFVEGELAFKGGMPRVVNPYTTSSPILEQVWMNGWDHGRRIGKNKTQMIGRDTV